MTETALTSSLPTPGPVVALSNFKAPAPLTKLTPNPGAVTTIQQFKATPKPVKMARKPKTLDDETATYLKILLYGNTGTGKTIAVAKLLELGLNILAVSSDFGGEGFGSVRQYLKETNQAHLLKNCSFFELQDYDEVDDFVFAPTKFWPEIYDHDFDLLFWDGFSSFQTCHVSNKVLAMTAQGNNVGQAREEGLFANQQDWGATKNATVKQLDKSLRMFNERTGKPWHKVFTCLESDNSKDNQGEKKIGPMIQGASAKLMEPSFDLIIRTKKKRVGDGEKRTMTYLYELDGASDRIITKKRGFNFNATEPGDFGVLWATACAQRGLPVGTGQRPVLPGPDSVS